MRLLNIFVIGALILAASFVYKIKFDSTLQAERVAKLAGELRRELCHAFGLQRGIKLDLVDEGRRQDERADDEDVEKAHAQCPFTTSASAGKRGLRSDASSARAGAALRSAARSLAERARGLCETSSASATTGRLVSTLNVGAGRLSSGA